MRRGERGGLPGEAPPAAQRQLSWRELRKRCDQLLKDIAVPDPFELDEFVTTVGRRRGRPVRVVTLPDGSEGVLRAMGRSTGTVCGLLVQLVAEDLIVVEPTDWVHRVHVGLHEIAHLVCGHLSNPPRGTAVGLFPDLDESLVRAVFGRSTYNEPQEREAEGLASLLSARLLVPSGRARRRKLRGGDDIIGRLDQALGGTSGC